MENKTWTDAWYDCLKNSGTLVPYETGIGVNIDSINLAKDSDVWTADYALQQSESQSSTKLCGFNYLSTTILSSQKFYGDCHAVRNYFCKNSTKIYILNGTHDNIRCKGVIILDGELLAFAQSIIPGFYWTDNTAYVKTETEKSHAPTQPPFLCGAFSAAPGKYFVNCSTKRSSLCYISDKPNQIFEKSCFTNGSPSWTHATKSTITSSTHKNLHTSPQSTSERKTTFKKTDAPTVARAETPLENGTTMTLTEATSQFKKTSSFAYSKTERHTESTDESIVIGLSVGLSVALICGILLSIYIIRRRQCWQMKNRHSETNNAVIYNNVSLARQNISRNTDQTRSNDREAGRNENQIPVYAVVRKSYPKQTTDGQRDSSPRQTNRPVHNLNLSKLNSKTNGLTNSSGAESSEYSFAEETEDLGEKYVTLRDNEYDVTGHERNFQTSDNIYNKFQTKNLDQSANVKRASNPLNLVEIVYDSTEQVRDSRQTDNVYNHLSAAETYNHVSSDATCRMQPSKVTDQIYS